MLERNLNEAGLGRGVNRGCGRLFLGRHLDGKLMVLLGKTVVNVVSKGQRRLYQFLDCVCCTYKLVDVWLMRVWCWIEDEDEY